MPRWDHGFLLFFSRSATPGTPPELWGYDIDGAIVIPPTSVAFPDAHHADIRSVAGFSNGTMLISAEVWDNAGQAATVLATVGRGGKLIDVVRTQSFVATHLAIDSKGQVWAAGVNPDLESKTQSDYPVLQRYDPGLKFNETLLTRNQFANDRSPTGFGTSGSSALVGAAGRVALYASDTREWIEFDECGRMLSRFTVQPVIGIVKIVNGSKAGSSEAAAYRMRDIVMTESGRVYAWLGYPSGSSERDAPLRGLYQLDRRNHKWIAMPARFWDPRYQILYGTSGDQVFLLDGCCRFGLFTPPDVLLSHDGGMPGR